MQVTCGEFLQTILRLMTFPRSNSQIYSLWGRVETKASVGGQNAEKLGRVELSQPRRRRSGRKTSSKGKTRNSKSRRTKEMNGR